MFAQKMANNELGYLMDINGMPTKFMDFWTCCADGALEDVLIYIHSRQPVNEEGTYILTCCILSLSIFKFQSVEFWNYRIIEL